MQPLQIVCETKEDAGVPSPASPFPYTGVRYNAKVLLSTSYPHSDITRITDMHLSKALKFLVGKDRDGILALGGQCDPERDGGDPSESRVLINAAKRHVYDLTRLDLSPIENWVRFVEVWYQRDDYQEVTVIFVPDLSEIAPTMEQFLAQWERRQAEEAEKEKREKGDAPKEGVENKEGGESKESEEKTEAEKTEAEKKKEEEEREMARVQAESPMEPKDDAMEDEEEDEEKKKEEQKKKEQEEAKKKKEEPPREPCFYATTHKTPESKRKCMVISLDGLLDYDETDKTEANFELSLFAESYHLMLQVMSTYLSPFFSFSLSPRLFFPLNPPFFYTSFSTAPPPSSFYFLYVGMMRLL